jgi:integrase/recombinase XerD
MQNKEICMAARKFVAIRRIPPGSETESAIRFSREIHARAGHRKYLNAAERRRFVKAAGRAPADTRLFCLMLRWSGARISEVLALTPAAIDIESGVACIPTIKRRKRGIIRQVPLPPNVLQELNRVFKLWIAQRDPQLLTLRLWRWSRTTAWRYVKAVMAAAGIAGAAAVPKDLRHGFGLHAVQSKVPLHLVQRWLGHASLRSTAIYLDVIGPEEERAIAARMWCKRSYRVKPS